MPETIVVHFDPATPGVLWSAGLPFCSQRALTADERRRVEKLRRRLLVQGSLFFGTGPGLFLASVVVWLSNPNAESSWQFLAIGVFLGLLILGLAVSPGGWALLREAQTLKAALQLGVVDRFGSSEADELSRNLEEIEPEFYADDALNGLEEREPREPLRRIELEFGGGRVVVRWLESLHGSGLIVASNARLPRGHHYAPAVALAEVPQYAGIAAEWAAPLDPADPQSPLLNRRPLTPQEAAEIVALRRGLLKMPGVLVALGTLVLGFMIVANASSVPPNAWNDGLGFPLILLSFGGVALLRDYLRYRALRQDEAAGMVLIIRTSLPEEVDSPHGPQLSPPTELLPFSRIVWTHDGQPAPWRSS